MEMMANTKTYTVIVQSAEEGGFWAEFPELPGCFTQGETLDELAENIPNAIETHTDEKFSGQLMLFMLALDAPEGEGAIAAESPKGRAMHLLDALRASTSEVARWAARVSTV